MGNIAKSDTFMATRNLRLQEDTTLSDYLDAGHRSSLQSLMLNYEITIVSGAYWMLKPSWSVSPRKIPDSMFVFPFYANLRGVIGDREYTVRPGEFLMIPENMTQSLSFGGKFTHMEQITLHCYIHDQWGRNLLSRFPSYLGQLPDLKSWVGPLKELVCLLNSNPQAGNIHGAAILREILAYQLTQWPEMLAEAPTGDPRVSLAIETMKRDFASPDLTVTSLAAIVDIKAVQFRKLFRRETGESPKRFLNKLRMNKATHLLRYTTVSVKEVALSCGFSSDHYFHPAFFKEYGRSPSAFRKGEM